MKKHRAQMAGQAEVLLSFGSTQLRMGSSSVHVPPIPSRKRAVGGWGATFFSLFGAGRLDWVWRIESVDYRILNAGRDGCMSPIDRIRSY